MLFKSMSSLLMLVILCEGIQSTNGEALQCEFEYFGALGTLYSCYVTSLENPNDNKIITGYNGVHQSNKHDRDVKQICIQYKNTKYIPAGLGSLFNLTALLIHTSQLVVIRSKDFQGMQNLEYLSLSSNKLTSVPSDAFSTLPKLKHIFLLYNQIKYIGSGAFDQLKNLIEVYLPHNICVNKYYFGVSGIAQMKRDLKVNCVEPISTSTTTTTTTQNPMEVELRCLRKELAASSEELQKEKSENLKVKNERDALMMEKDALTSKCEANQQKSMEFNLICDFKMINDGQYTCETRDLTIHHKDVKFNEVIGTHMKFKSNEEVTELIIVKSSMSYWSKDIFTKFPALQTLRIQMNPNDSHEIIIKLKEEKKQLIMDKDALKTEKDALMFNHDELKAQNDALIKDKDVLHKMLNNQQTECETKTQELMSKLSHLIQPTEEELICDFNDETYNILGLLYSCDVTSLDNKCNNKVIKGQNGVHKDHRNVENVKAIYIYNTNATHIPEGLGSLFNLTAFQMFNTQLKEIRTKDFENMENLEYFNFDYNKLTLVPLEVLQMLKKLKYISLQSNLISELTPGLFDNNLELVEVYLDRNRIQVIASGLFNGLTKLTTVHMTGNKCVDKIYEGITEMVQMRKDVELNCKVQQ